MSKCEHGRGDAMETLINLWMGLQQSAAGTNLVFCFIGVFLGTLIGVLPGLGPSATIAMLLPLTYQLSPLASIIMLAGIFYGAQYGGSTTAILVNLPGEASAVVTCLDGHAMALRGRAGAALAISAIGSFIAGTLTTLVIAFAAPPLATLAITFGPAEYVALMLFGLVGATILASGSVLSAVGMILLGILLGLVGTDISSGAPRFTFDLPVLFDGLGFVTVAVGIFGLTEIVVNLESGTTRNLSYISYFLALANSRGFSAKPAGNVAWHDIRIDARSPARCWGNSQFVCIVFAREENIEAPRAIRTGDGGGSCRPRSGKQCGCSIVFYSTAYPGNSSRCSHGPHDWRNDDSRGFTRAWRYQEQPRPLLGSDRQHVDRQLDAACH